MDVFTQGIAMKKSRLGTLLTVICSPELADSCQQIIFQETTTLGIRERTQQRNILDRQIESVATRYGTVRVKIASWHKASESTLVNIQPEYEDCASLARLHDVPWQTVRQAAISSFSDG